ncbi:MAG TPA: hypothetical protein VEL07_01095 [Planctomycetota bacterium]|nr:hypothetical protein [Planctomycetota bacterium]
MSPRHGAVLIVVAGLAAVIAAMALAFLARMRADADDSAVLVREVQARLMLAAALQYVNESGRLGHGEEAFGWRDVRSGLPGPRDLFGRKLYVGDDLTGIGGAFPAVGGVARCPVQRLIRPPYAIRQDLVPNPIALDPGRSWAELVNHTVPTPQRSSDVYADFAAGDRRPVGGASGQAWFRVRREDIDTFLITCGSGVTLAFRDFAEADAQGFAAAFGSKAAFDHLRAHERLLHARVRWSPAVAGNAHMHYREQGSFVLNPFATPNLPIATADDQPNSRSMMGGFAFIMVLREPPPVW